MNPLLREEHEYLGARLRTVDALERVDGYLDSAAEREGLSSGAGLVDMAGTASWLLSGEVSEGFAGAAFAGRRLGVGKCAFESTLLGDGSVASVVLLARTGTGEYVCWDGGSRAQVLDGWLSFLSSIEQGGVRPFAGLSIEDASESLAPLVLWGPRSRVVLGDYLAEGVTLPEAGQVVDLRLDSIPALVVCPPIDSGNCLMLLVPPGFVRVLWRSLLSFATVVPVGMDALEERVRACLPWYGTVCATIDKLWLAASELGEWGLMREGEDYVGARGIHDDGPGGQL